MKKVIIITCLLFSLTFVVMGQGELMISTMPSISTFHKGNKNLRDSYIFPIGYGLKFNYTHKKLTLSTGLLQLTQGEKVLIEKTTVDNPEGTGEYYDMITKVKKIIIPINVAYNFIELPRSIFFCVIGIYSGHIYSQQIENTSIPIEWESDPTIISAVPMMERFTEVDIFNNYYFGLNLGIGWKQKFSNKFSLQISPNFLYQIRQGGIKAEDPNFAKMMTLSLEFGICYRFKKIND
jgi:hypothetical protein